MGVEGGEDVGCEEEDEAGEGVLDSAREVQF